MRRGRATLVLLLAASAASTASAQDVSEDVLRLEAALARAAYRLDPPQILAAERSLLTAVYETYCAVDLLLPRQGGIRTVDLVLGLGCALGATSLYVAAFRRFRTVREAPEARALLRRFQGAMAQGPPSRGVMDATLADLEGLAERGRRRRIVEGVFGVLNFVTSATLIGLTARERIDRDVGVVIATGTASIGVISLASWFTRSSAEQALAAYESPLAPEAW